MKQALVVRHTPYEGIAGFRLPVEEAGYEITRVDMACLNGRDIDFLSPDLVLVMGGPMGVYEQDQYPWIGPELSKLRERLAANAPTVGVCLGSQMIAAALGARVYPGPTKQVGFAPVTLKGTATSAPLKHIEGVPVLHWHGDTFDLPEGVELLASSDNYVHEAYRRGPNLLALQFHPEMGEDPRFDVWLEDVDYIAEAGTDVATLRADHDRLGPPAVEAGRKLMQDWLAQLD